MPVINAALPPNKNEDMLMKAHADGIESSRRFHLGRYQRKLEADKDLTAQQYCINSGLQYSDFIWILEELK